MKGIFLFLVLFLSSCFDNYRSDHIVSNGLYDKAELALKADRYVRTMLSLRDEYGLILPRKDGIPIQQGDALLWNSIALAALCLIDKQGEAQELWNLYKKLQLSNGRLIRHPSLIMGNQTATSISKDGIVGVMFLGAVIADADCDLKEEYKNLIAKFAQYVVSNNYEMGVGITHPSVTFLSDRHVLRMVLKLYDLDTTILDYKTSVHDLEYSSKIAPLIFTYNFHCKAGNQKACNVGFPGAFTNHLTFLTAYIALIDSQKNEDSQYSIKEVFRFLYDISLSGQNEDIDNWLYLSIYWNQIGKSVDPIGSFLMNNFSEVVSEKEEVIGWGCTDYIWQRVPYEECTNSDTQYTGIDFLILYALNKNQL